MRPIASLFCLPLVVTLILATTNAHAKDHSPEYRVGYFSATDQMSDGTHAYCSGHNCSSYNAGHNIHYVRTDTGMYTIQAPVAVGRSIMVGVLTDGIGPTMHQQWFMDQLHEGDKVLFFSKCGKHNNCIFYLPNPDKIGKEFATLGYFSPDKAMTNTQTLCGKGKLSPAVESLVCSSVAPTPVASAIPAAASTLPTSQMPNNVVKPEAIPN